MTEYKPPSFFRSATHTFLKMFFGLLGVFAAFLIFGIVSALFFNSPISEGKTEITLLPDANANRELLAQTAPVILQISIHDFIGKAKQLDTETIQDILLDSQSGVLGKGRVKGILLHFNTGGGTALDSRNIYDLIVQYKQKHHIPVYAYVDGLCASGGMMIACAADQIFAGPNGIIGSVGVLLGPIPNFSELLNKVGVSTVTLSEGIDKDEFNPTRPWKPDEGGAWRAILPFEYNQFVDLVVQARPRLDRTKLVEEYGARIFDCVTAEKLGYIDVAMSSRNHALAALVAAAEIPEQTPYQVVSLSPKSPWIPGMLSAKSPLFTGKLEHSLEGIALQVPLQPCYLYSPTDG